MKKLLHYADCLMLLAGIIGCVLRLRFDNTGLDGYGLYRTNHPAWIGLCVLTVGVLVFNYFMTRDPGDSRDYRQNFPGSKVGAVTCVALAVSLGYNGIMGLLSADTFLDVLVALTSMLSAISLGVAGVERFCGNQPLFICHMVPCVYFALRVFAMGRDLGTDPEICRFLFQFLASLSMIPAFYWLWAFDVGLGNRRRSLFFSLCALYFCLVAVFEAKEGVLMYLLYSAMLLTNMCSLRYLPADEAAEQPVAEVEEQPAAAAEEKPAVEAEAQPAPVPLIFRGPATEMEQVEDFDAFLEETKQYLDSLGYES